MAGAFDIIFSVDPTTIEPQDAVALDGVGIGQISIDATVQQEHKLASEVSDNPVEDGSNIVDHVNLLPFQLTLNGVITDSPIKFGVFSSVVNAGQTIATLFGQTRRSIEAYQQLEKLWESRVPLTIITSLKEYKDMIIESLSVPRTAQTGNAIHFTISFRQIKRVNSVVVDAASFKSDVRDLATSTKNKGNKISGEVAATADKPRGLFEGIAEFFYGK